MKRKNAISCHGLNKGFLIIYLFLKYILYNLTKMENNFNSKSWLKYFPFVFLILLLFLSKACVNRVDKDN